MKACPAWCGAADIAPRSSRAKKIEAAFRISLASLRSRISRSRNAHRFTALLRV